MDSPTAENSSIVPDTLSISSDSIEDTDLRTIEQFAATHLNTNLVNAEKNSDFQSEAWQQCAKFGVLRWSVPKDHGGCGYSLSKTSALLEALGYGCRDNGLLFGLGMQMWAIQKALLKFGSEPQVSHYLPDILLGQKIGCFAINEASSGSDALSLSTTADLNGSHYILNGEKTLITFSPIAQFAIVFAATNPKAGRWGLSAFLIDTDSPGVTVHKADNTMGLRTAPVGKITLSNCKVPTANLLGKEGSGASIFNLVQIWERNMLLAPQIGTMRRQLDECVKFAKSRIRANQTIGKHQVVSNRIADMAINLESSRLLQQKSAAQLDQEKYDLYQAAITKTIISESFEKNSREMIAIMGGHGYLTESESERCLRDAIGSTIYGGTTDIQRNIISGILGL